ncbi:hypothetical protein EXS71_02860 [Candidatus Uhrbacteria bacterium]|nr:hypothetical protein [Candidatus Uhrbacteria bacterium]
MSQPVITTHQPSMTEWFEAIGDKTDSEAFRAEDNKKVDRLEILYQTIELPYERSEPFPARALFDRSPEFMRVLETRGAELCAIRLVPSRADLPKLRQRGLSLKECYENWFLQQEINPDDYTAYVCPHSETLLWSATFVVNQDRIFGEIIEGLHSQLTHGDTKKPLYQFFYNGSEWKWSTKHPEAAKQIARMIDLIRVSDRNKQSVLEERLQAEFYRDYLGGYFESTVWPDDRVYIIDYNRLLPKFIPTPSLTIWEETKESGMLKGSVAYPGYASGPVVIVAEGDLSSIEFPEGAILVCDNTDVRYLPLMKKAGAIVTNRGGILSHAAIVARELKKPCLIGTGDATTKLKTGDQIEVDADHGIVRKI